MVSTGEGWEGSGGEEEVELKDLSVWTGDRSAMESSSPISTVGQEEARESLIVELSLKFVGEIGEDGEFGLGWADCDEQGGYEQRRGKYIR